MDQLTLALALAWLTGWLVTRFGGRAFESMSTGISQLVGGYRDAGWPKGMQEEDRHMRWGRAIPVAAKTGHASLPPMPAPVLTKVKPTVHTR